MKFIALFLFLNAFAKDLDLNPVKHEPSKNPAQAESVPQLNPISSICDIGNQHYRVSDHFDEVRCSERGGQIRAADGDGRQYTDIKQAVPPIKAHYYNRPLQPPDDHTLTNPHYNPLQNTRADQPNN